MKKGKKKTRDELFAEIMTGMSEAISIMKGEADPATYRVHVPEEVDVKVVRAKTGLSQNAFADTFGFSAGAVRDWEQKRRIPEPPTRMYLWMIGEKHELVQAVIRPLAKGDKKTKPETRRRSRKKPAADPAYA